MLQTFTCSYIPFCSPTSQKFCILLQGFGVSYPEGLGHKKPGAVRSRPDQFHQVGAPRCVPGRSPLCSHYVRPSSLVHQMKGHGCTLCFGKFKPFALLERWLQAGCLPSAGIRMFTCMEAALSCIPMSLGYKGKNETQHFTWNWALISSFLKDKATEVWMDSRL